MDYANLLERAYRAMPTQKTKSERFECPTAEVFIEGNKTSIKNFDAVCSTLRRKPEEVSKYLFKELAVPGNVSGSRLILQGKFPSRTINDRIQTYCKTSVICKECGKPDTHLESIERNLKMLLCEACGAKSPVRY
ncbi:MAG: translation initiation factor IF-2 subunit beta [Candidatus Micrarchaeia archaeon]